jgi:hypothetical protein
MEYRSREGERVTLCLSVSEVLTISNALNEVCNGMSVPEFETRMGVSRAEVQSLLAQVHSVLERFDYPSAGF